MRTGALPDVADDAPSDIPARLDRLPWGAFHWRVVIALGVTWILDGLEVTLAGSLGPALLESPVLQLTPTALGLSASAYLAGAVVGAIVFGWLADRLGRKRLFFATLLLYTAASIATGFAWDAWSFALFRALTGAGIGGEYAAVNSAIQELVPARLRGRVDLAVNGTFWAGAALGGLLAILVLDPGVVDPEVGWRAAFVVGGAMALSVLLLRRWIPESPRWLLLHGRGAEAAAILATIEREAQARHGPLPPPATAGLRLHRRGATTIGDVIRAMTGPYRRRTVLGLVLMAAQAFCYNAVGFTFSLMLTGFHGIGSRDVGWYVLPWALCNLAGPLVLGRWFDTVGRRPMITGTYAMAGVLMAGTAWAFAQDWLTAWQLTACWGAVFFFASAAASAAYLTVGESFPMEMRALAIALFFAFGTALGGIAGPAVFGALVEGGARGPLAWAFAFAASLMLGAAAVAWRLGFAAEGRSLEAIAPPLAAVSDHGPLR